MVNTYPNDAPIDEKLIEELRCIRCALERILTVMDRSAFVDYQMEKFGEDFRQDRSTDTNETTIRK